MLDHNNKIDVIKLLESELEEKKPLVFGENKIEAESELESKL
jgi:hypothetical protein